MSSMRTLKVQHLVNGPTHTYERTDHSEEIALIRKRANKIIKSFPFDDDTAVAPSQSMMTEATLLMTAAALLECHDDTGISLDNWRGPRECVEMALVLIGLDPEVTFLENGV